MNKEEFAKIMIAIKAAYPQSNIATDNHSRDLWYEMLKDLEYDQVSNTVYKHIQSSRYIPTIAELRGNDEIEKKSWTLEWMKLLNGARVVDLNEPGQYAFRLLTRDCFESCLHNPEKLMQCMKVFESLYTQYDTLDEGMKAEFKALTAPAPVPQIECEEEVGDDW